MTAPTTREEAIRIQEATNRDLAQRLTQAERQRDELRKALERIKSGRATVTECSLIARQALANQGGDPSPVKKERAWICPQDNTPCPPECDSDDRRHCASVACKEQPE